MRCVNGEKVDSFDVMRVFLHEVVFLALQGAMNDVFPRRSCFVPKGVMITMVTVAQW